VQFRTSRSFPRPRNNRLGTVPKLRRVRRAVSVPVRHVSGQTTRDLRHLSVEAASNDTGSRATRGARADARTYHDREITMRLELAEDLIETGRISAGTQLPYPLTTGLRGVSAAALACVRGDWSCDRVEPYRIRAVLDEDKPALDRGICCVRSRPIESGTVARC
jgi:hypothetical protein